jgi:hypothetical protein
MQDALSEQRASGDGMKVLRGTIPLASLLFERKDYSSFEVDLSTSEEAVIRARECQGTSDGKLCSVCKALSRSLAFMKRQTSPEIVEMSGAMHITPERIQILGNEKAAEAMKIKLFVILRMMIYEH